MLDEEQAAAVFVQGVRGLISCEETGLDRPDGRDEPPLHKSSNPFPIRRIRVRPKMNFQKFCILVSKIRTENKETWKVKCNSLAELKNI